MQSENQTEKQGKSLRAMWNNIKENEIPVTEFPKRKERVNGAEIIPEEIKTEKISNLVEGGKSKHTDPGNLSDSPAK